MIIYDPEESRSIFQNNVEEDKVGVTHSYIPCFYLSVLNMLASTIWNYSANIILIIFLKIPFFIIFYIKSYVHFQLESVISKVKLS